MKSWHYSYHCFLLFSLLLSLSSFLYLQIINWQISANLLPYWISTGMSAYCFVLINNTISVTTNNYLGVPLMYSQFGDWLMIDRPLHPLPYIGFLDKGLPRYMQVVWAIIYFGLNIIFAVLNKTYLTS